MNRLRIFVALLPFGLALSVGSAAADGPGSDYGAVKEGRVKFIDRAMNLVQLDDGTELRTTNAWLLRDIREGEEVRVDFVHDGDTNMINSIEPAQPDTQLGAVPTAPGPDTITSH